MYGICVSLHLPVYEAISRVLNIELKVSAGSQAQFDVFFIFISRSCQVYNADNWVCCSVSLSLIWMLRGLFSASGLRCDVKCSVAAGQENEGQNERLQMVVEMKAFKPLGGLQNGAAS